MNRAFSAAMAEKPAEQAKAQRAVKKSYKAPAGKINQVLKQATKPDLNAVKSKWGEVLEQLGLQNQKSLAALLTEAEPVAASTEAFVVKWQWKITVSWK